VPPRRRGTAASTTPRRGHAPRRGPVELYDLVADPAEARDVADAHPAVVARMTAILDREHVPDPAWPLPFAEAPSRAAAD